jgi:peptide/nickel transport system permease protein
MALADPPPRLVVAAWSGRRACRRACGGTARVPWIPIVIISVIVDHGGVRARCWRPIRRSTRPCATSCCRRSGWTAAAPKYLLGTDAFGRDVLSRLIYGARVSLLVALLALTAGGGVGLLIGIVAGYVGGAVDSI